MNSANFEVSETDLKLLRLTIETLYKSNGRLKTIVLVLALLIGLLILCLVYISTREVNPPAYAVTKDGRVYPLKKIEGDIFNSQFITRWSIDHATDLYNFTFRTIEGEWPNSLSEFMFDSAKKDWIGGLQKQGYISDVIAKRAVMYALLDGEPLYRGKSFNEKQKVDVSVVEIPLKVVIDARGELNDRNREMRVVLRLSIAHVGLGNNKFKDGLAIGMVKLAARK